MVVYVSGGVLCVRDSERARALCVRDVWLSEQHVLTTLRVHTKRIIPDISHVRVPHRTSRAASHGRGHCALLRMCLAQLLSVVSDSSLA